MRRLKDHQLDSQRVKLVEDEIKEARGTQSTLKKYIDTRGYIDFKLNDAVWTGNAIYVPINGGTAFIKGETIQIDGMINFNIFSPSINTTYYFFLDKSGAITYTADDPTEGADNMILGAVIVGDTVMDVQTKDLRQILHKDGLYEEIVEARSSYATLKEYIDTKGYLEFMLWEARVNGTDIDILIKGGHAWVLDNLIEKDDQLFKLLSPSLNTTYYFYLNEYGNIVFDTALVEARNKMILGALTIGSSLDQLTLRDLRKLLNKDGIYEEIVEARKHYATLNDRINAEITFTADVANTRAAIICFKDLLTAHMNDILQAIIPEDMTLTKIIIHSDQAPTGGDLVLDLNRNQVSIFPNETWRPRVLDSTNDTTLEVEIDFDEGDILSVDIDETGSIKSGGQDLLITLKFKLRQGVV